MACPSPSQQCQSTEGNKKHWLQSQKSPTPFCSSITGLPREGALLPLCLLFNASTPASSIFHNPLQYSWHQYCNGKQMQTYGVLILHMLTVRSWPPTENRYFPSWLQAMSDTWAHISCTSLPLCRHVTIILHSVPAAFLFVTVLL